MSFVSDFRGLLRFGLGLKTLVREPISVEAARERLSEQLRARESTFLEMTERAVFHNPRSPYRQLLEHAGCELGDLRRLVDQEGLEGALERLLRHGVYVTFEEFKGFAPAVRGSRSFDFRDGDFDNPLITRHYGSSSGGTRGRRPTRVVVDLEHIAQSAPHWAVWFDEHDLLDSPLVYYTPTHAGICNSLLRCAGFGKRVDRWYSIARMATWRDRMVAGAVQYQVRRALGLPRPEFIPIDESWKIGEYLAELVAQGHKPSLNTYPSASVRICRAMEERGLSIRGSTFLLRGEALSEARRASIEAVGARAVQTYGFAEGGTVGSQCGHPRSADDVHLYEDVFAVIQRPRVLDDGIEVGSLLLTGLRRACPKVLLNTEIGDHGVLSSRECDCLFGRLGFRRHLESIRGFDKITSEGMTFFGPDLIRLLEHVLPQRFGGVMTDYQLIEEEDARGLCRYALLVSPEVGTVEEDDLVATFLEELGKMRRYYGFKVDLWSRAGTLEVRRQRPLITSRGKTLPFRAVQIGS
ncbi:MAG: hypothetical protein WAO20_12605 [Acidobacteriota bacterium]